VAVHEQPELCRQTPGGSVMITLALSKDEIDEIMYALTGAKGDRYASPSLVRYMKGKEKEAQHAEYKRGKTHKANAEARRRND